MSTTPQEMQGAAVGSNTDMDDTGRQKQVTATINGQPVFGMPKRYNPREKGAPKSAGKVGYTFTAQISLNNRIYQFSANAYEVRSDGAVWPLADEYEAIRAKKRQERERNKSQ